MLNFIRTFQLSELLQLDYHQKKDTPVYFTWLGEEQIGSFQALLSQFFIPFAKPLEAKLLFVFHIGPFKTAHL